MNKYLRTALENRSNSNLESAYFVVICLMFGTMMATIMNIVYDFNYIIDHGKVNSNSGVFFTVVASGVVVFIIAPFLMTLGNNLDIYDAEREAELWRRRDRCKICYSWKDSDGNKKERGEKR